MAADRDVRTLRVPADLSAKLRDAAEQNGCSVNAEIIRRLRASLESYRR